MTKKYTNKLKNHKYSPGIATYGLRGPAGKDGLHGNGFFICAYNLSNTESETRTIAINKLNNNEYLSDNVNEKITRKYLANDLIIDITGSIYSVVEVQNEQGMIERLSFSEEPIGNIELINEAGLNARIFNTGVFKRIVNNADIEGLDIVTDTELLKSDEYNDINSRKYPIRIFNSDKDIIMSLSELNIRMGYFLLLISLYSSDFNSSVSVTISKPSISALLTILLKTPVLNILAFKPASLINSILPIGSSENDKRSIIPCSFWTSTTLYIEPVISIIKSLAKYFLVIFSLTLSDKYSLLFNLLIAIVLVSLSVLDKLYAHMKKPLPCKPSLPAGPLKP